MTRLSASVLPRKSSCDSVQIHMADHGTPKFSLQLAKRCSPNNAATSSPMTDLALNLEELSCLFDTPKRRISWSSSTSGSPGRPQLLSLRDDGFYDSPATICESSVFGETSLEKEVNCENIAPSLSRSKTLLHRLHSAPSPLLSHYLEKANVPKSSSSSSSCVTWSSPSKSCAKDERHFEDHDSTSRDSGYSEKDEGANKVEFKFTEPVGIAPRRLRSFSSLSPTKAALQHPLSPVSIITIPLSYPRESLSEIDERISDAEDVDDDGFLEELDMDIPNENISIGIAQLISAKMPSPNSLPSSKTCSLSRPPLHDFCNLDFMETPKGKGCSRGLFVGKRSECNVEMDRKLALKRSDVPRDLLSPIQNKRRKSVSLCYRRCENKLGKDDFQNTPKRVTLQRCHSETEATIMRAVQRSVQEPNLIGDFSRPYILPLTNGKHQDLNCISHHTTSRLIMGEYSNEVEKFLIVDCRYPYEYDGGHIKGALNVYTKEGIIQEFLSNPMKVMESNKRLLVIFHCEFSSERGPNLSRFLRNKDREANKECYPQLFYPEIYLIDGGYKTFFENHKAMCEPQEYKPMLHKDHEKDMRHFRAKSKSWNGDKAGRHGPRPGLKL